MLGLVWQNTTSELSLKALAALAHVDEGVLDLPQQKKHRRWQQHLFATLIASHVWAQHTNELLVRLPFR
eukprot:97968-Amphidinium_carterae.1